MRTEARRSQHQVLSNFVPLGNINNVTKGTRVPYNVRQDVLHADNSGPLATLASSGCSVCTPESFYTQSTASTVQYLSPFPNMPVLVKTLQ